MAIAAPLIAIKHTASFYEYLVQLQDFFNTEFMKNTQRLRRNLCFSLTSLSARIPAANYRIQRLFDFEILLETVAG